MPIEQPYPDLELLQEEYLLVEAWKKTVAHLRAHNWFADTLEIDRASAELPQFLRRVARRLSDPDGYTTRRLRLVPAPKSHPWIFTKNGGNDEWKPKPDSKGLGPRIRPLAHVALEDQVAATAIMLCLADRVESRQGDPTGSLTDAAHRRRVLSYGNRLLCDGKSNRLRHRWGSSAMYRGYFQDYQAFVARPDVAASSVSEEGSRIVIVQSDLQNFYDRVTPELLGTKIRQLRQVSESLDFFELAQRVLTWSWHPRDKKSVTAYAKRECIPDFSKVALPQGLASAGFFSNAVLLDFDHRLRSALSSEIFSGAQLVDVVRYVDDLRVVLKLESDDLHLADIEEETVSWLNSLLNPEQALRVARKKTHASNFGTQSDRPTARQGERMARIQRKVSGGFDIAGGEAVLEAVRGLMQTRRHPLRHQVEETGWPLSPVADVPEATVARFGAGRYRQAYRWLRPLSENNEALVGDSEAVADDGSESATLFRTQNQAELDNDAEVFAARLVQDWVEDPSNIRLLRIAFDIWPSSSTLKRVLDLLIPYAVRDCDDEAHQIARYCLGDLFRAGATETGIVREQEALPLSIEEYRRVLRSAAQRIIGHKGAEVPWYLRQQALLFLATCGSTLDGPISRAQEVPHYAALLSFLSHPDSVASPSDFATYAVLTRHSFAPKSAIGMLASHVTGPRLKKIAEADPNLAIELVHNEPSLSKSLPDHVQRDLCLTRSVPADEISLADLVLKDDNPFRDELSLLQFAIKALDIIDENKGGSITPVDLEVIIPDTDPWLVREGKFSLKLHRRRLAKSSIYSPPSWCPAEERWRFQLGYLLRFILTGQEDFTASVRPTPWKELRGDSYRPAPMPWRMRRYGFFSAHEAFGDRWLPITEWTTRLSLNLLAWPGARRPNHRWVKQGLDETSGAIKRRVKDILKLQGRSRSELLLRVEAIPPDPVGYPRSLRAAIVQTILPERSWFEQGNETLTRDQRRRVRRHLSAALATVRSTLRLRRTHMSGTGDLDLLILPELSVHIDDLWILKRFAITHRTIVLAGLVYHQAREGDNREYVNSAVWLIPEQTSPGGRQVRIIDQGKHNLADAEKEAGLHLRPFRTSQWLIGYPWSQDNRKKRLWLTASVCYDATNLALGTELTGKSDVYVIVARNQDVTTFDTMAKALSYHTFQMVIVANDGEIGGSNAYGPYKDRHRRRVFHFYGQEQAAIAYLTIDPIDVFLQRVENAQGEEKDRQFKHLPAGRVDMT